MEIMSLYTSTVKDVLIIIFMLSIVGLFFFTAVKPSLRIARWLYLLFSVMIIILLPVLIDGLEEKWLIIWPLLFVAAGIYCFIGITITLKDIKDTPKEEEANKALQKKALKGGTRRALKNIIKK